MALDGIEGASDSHDRDPSMAAEDHVLITPGRQGPCARVEQGPRTPKVERCVSLIASSPVEVGGESVHAIPRRLQ